jgi:hypothetical protein
MMTKHDFIFFLTIKAGAVLRPSNIKVPIVTVMLDPDLLFINAVFFGRLHDRQQIF